ncbi:MAG: hypothetical protein ABIO45_07840 [Burkholderiaceae bacterium]
MPTMVLPRRLAYSAAAALLAAGLLPVRAAAQAIDRQASALIRAVSRAAEERDEAALRSAMRWEFIWSFGGDASADQAIAHRMRDPQSLRMLARITRARSVDIDKALIECPALAATAPCAGFQRVGAAWKRVYFVAGDQRRSRKRSARGARRAGRWQDAPA